MSQQNYYEPNGDRCVQFRLYEDGSGHIQVSCPAEGVITVVLGRDEIRKLSAQLDPARDAELARVRNALRAEKSIVRTLLRGIENGDYGAEDHR